MTLYVVNTDDVTTHLQLAPPPEFADRYSRIPSAEWLGARPPLLRAPSHFWCLSCFSDHYYTRVAWLENRVFVTWTNRAQNSTVYMLYDPDTAAGVKVTRHIAQS